MKDFTALYATLSLLFALPTFADTSRPIKINMQGPSSLVIQAAEGENKLIASKIYTCNEPKVSAVAGAEGTELFELDPGMDSPVLIDANDNTWIVHCAEKTNRPPIPPPPSLR